MNLNDEILDCEGRSPIKSLFFESLDHCFFSPNKLGKFEGS